LHDTQRGTRTRNNHT
jgi:hypothetical protein